MKRFVLMFVLVSVVSVSPVWAVAISWDGQAGDGLWSSVTNWSTDTFPVRNVDDVTIDGADVEISGVFAAQGKILTLNNGASVTVLDPTPELPPMTGSQNSYDGWVSNNTYVNSGSVIDNSDFFRQAGLICVDNSRVTNRAGGTLISSSWIQFANGADLIMLGGEYRFIPAATTISSYGADYFGNEANGSIIDVHNGVINMRTAVANPTLYFAEVNAKIAAGTIIGFGGAGTAAVRYTFDESPWKAQGIGCTQIYATPEPATIATLCLGGLFLRRRRS